MIARPATALLAASLAMLGAARDAHADATDECIAESEAGQRLLLAEHFVASRPHFIACGRAACPALVSRDCAERLRQAESAMATVLVVARRADGSSAPGASVTIDDAPSSSRIDGTALDVDPGVHAFKVTMPGAAPVVQQVTVQQGARLQSITVTFPASPAPGAPQPPAPGPSEPPSQASTSGNGWRTAAYVIGGIGLAGLAAGGVLGAVALSAQSREKSDCASLAACTNPGPARGDYSTAGAFADASTAAFVAGGVLAAGGVAMWLLVPSSSNGAATTGVQIVPSPAAFVVRGSF